MRIHDHRLDKLTAIYAYLHQIEKHAARAREITDELAKQIVEVPVTEGTTKEEIC